ncbi:MAG TPA: hypothetical protein VGU25_05985 [Acidobacteriaceae bacterium]|nr:hypothetical protein [Acidobacteriaceae bacterium]
MGRRISALAGLVAVLSLSGCKSPYVSATVRNDTGAAVTLVEVDYPSASFGRESLIAGASYPYRFKILGSGATKVSWTDAQHKQHTGAGPDLHEGQQGSLTITLTPAGAQWSPQLTP